MQWKELFGFITSQLALASIHHEYCEIYMLRANPQCSAAGCAAAWTFSIIDDKAYAPTPVVSRGPPLVSSTTFCPGRRHRIKILSRNQVLNPKIRGFEDLMTARLIPPTNQLRVIVCLARDIPFGLLTIVVVRD